MKFGLMYGITTDPREDSISTMVSYAKRVEELGFSTLWVPNILGFDAITACAVVGQHTSRIELGTAVVPTFPRHPLAIAQQALTAAAACGDRFTLGIGLSHQPMIEGIFGLSYDKPARHMKEYLGVLTPLLRGEPVKYEGELYRVQAELAVPAAPKVPLVVAALGPIMLGHAGKHSEGTITWVTGVKTLADHIVPTITKAAKDAGRGAPRIIAGLPITLTNDVDAAKKTIGKIYKMYGYLPSYRAMLDREGAEGPADVALVGDEKELRAQLQRLRDAGVTDFDAAPTAVDAESGERTLEFLASEL